MGKAIVGLVPINLGVNLGYNDFDSDLKNIQVERWKTNNCPVINTNTHRLICVTATAELTQLYSEIVLQVREQETTSRMNILKSVYSMTK